MDAYIAKCKCGGLIFAASDRPECRKDNAHDIARLINDGYSIERMTVEEVRTSNWCTNRGNCQKGAGTDEIKRRITHAR